MWFPLLLAARLELLGCGYHITVPREHCGVSLLPRPSVPGSPKCASHPICAAWVCPTWDPHTPLASRIQYPLPSDAPASWSFHLGPSRPHLSHDIIQYSFPVSFLTHTKRCNSHWLLRCESTCLTWGRRPSVHVPDFLSVFPSRESLNT